MKNLLLSFLFLIVCNLSAAQNSFSVTPDTINVEKPITFDLFYDYALFTNNTSDSLFMRWKKVFMEMSAPPSHGGGGWDLSILDPNNFYPDANYLDSADFVLTPVALTTDVFILQVSPNDIVGTLTAKFLFYPISDPSDTASVIINYESTSITSIEELSTRKITVIPNPATEYLEIINHYNDSKRVRLVNSYGKKCWEGILDKEEIKMVSINHFPSGIYFMTYENQNEFFIYKIIIH